MEINQNTPAEVIAKDAANYLQSLANMIKAGLDHEIKRDTDGDISTSPLVWTGNVKYTTNHWTNKVSTDEGEGPQVWFEFDDPRTDKMWISPEIRDGYHVSVFDGDI